MLAKGRRWGGNELLTNLGLESALQSGAVCWLSPSFTSNSFKRAWRYFTHYASQIPGSKVLVAEKLIHFAGGGFIAMRSAEHIDAVRGDAYDVILIDEGAFIDSLREMWDHVLRPALMDREGKAVMASSPNGFDDFHELWAMGQDPDFPDWESWQFPTWTNPFINPQEIALMRREMADLTFRQEVGAEFVARSGRVFGEFLRERNVREFIPYDPRLEVAVGLDFGYRSMAAVIAQPTNKRELLIIDENLWVERSVEQNLISLREQLNKQGIKVVHTIGCDPAGDATNDHTLASDVQLVRKHFPEASVGYSTAVNHRNPEWRAGEMRNMIYSASGQVRMFIARKCKETVKTLEQSVYPEHKPGKPLKEDPVKDGKIDHMRDALGYLVVRLFCMAKSRNEAY